jgi:uncharacterized protein YukJ
LALDFVRSQVNGKAMITKQQMTLLPKASTTRRLTGQDATVQAAKVAALKNAVVTLLNMTIADKDGVIYAFGSAYADSGKVDGIHDIHMNQGNPVGGGSGGGFGDDNGIWQDGALMIHLPSSNTWTAVFIAFQTESWNTDSKGNPV